MSAPDETPALPGEVWGHDVDGLRASVDADGKVSVYIPPGHSDSGWRTAGQDYAMRVLRAWAEHMTKVAATDRALREALTYGGAVTPARLDQIIAFARENGDRVDHELGRAFLLLADIRDAERALRKAESAARDAWDCVGGSDDQGVWAAAEEEVVRAESRLRALSVDP